MQCKDQQYHLDVATDDPPISLQAHESPAASHATGVKQTFERHLLEHRFSGVTSIMPTKYRIHAASMLCITWQTQPPTEI